jgi:hypothetical protein
VERDEKARHVRGVVATPVRVAVQRGQSVTFPARRFSFSRRQSETGRDAAPPLLPRNKNKGAIATHGSSLNANILILAVFEQLSGLKK